MRVTLKQIAELAGVSRGTVDRALNDRGRVDPEIDRKIKKIAKDLGYQPNTAGRALALSKNPIKIGIIIQLYETPFMQGVMRGVESAKEEIELLGGQVLLRKVRSINPYGILEAMDELSLLGVNGIALVPNDDQRVRSKIDEFVLKHNISIITLNSDIQDTKRLCFVGQNSEKSGRAAAGLMGEILGEKGTVSIISGHPDNLSLQNRVKGFETELRKSYPQIKLLPVKYDYDDYEIAKGIVTELLQEHSDIDGFFHTSSRIDGVCEVLKEKQLDQRIKVIGYDLTEENIMNLKSGAVNFLIGQNAYIQGYKPVVLLFQKYFQGKEPEDEFLYTDIEIKTKYNILP